MWYLTAAEGFRRAHPNISRDDLVAPDSPNFTPKLADADSLWSYELGYKSRMLEGQLAINAALYFIDWQDAQVSASRQSDAEPYLTNAGDIESMGIELDIRYLASASLELGGTLALNDSEVVSIDMNDSLASGLTLGSSLVAPETQASLYFQWQVAQLGAGAINLRGDMQYVEGYLNAPPNIPGVGVPNPLVMRTDSITNVAAQLGYETEKWGTYLYGENLSNDDGFAWINPDPFSSNNSVTLQPRTIGLRVNYQF
jgi:outer membrane receptor protein involved in Fe transport